MCVGRVNECHSSFILCYLLKSWVEYINQASFQRVLGNRNCISATSKRGSLIFTQGLLELSESVAIIKMGVDSKDTKKSQILPKGRDFETPLYLKRARSGSQCCQCQERRGEERTATFHQVFAVLDEGLSACCLRSTFFTGIPIALFKERLDWHPGSPTCWLCDLGTRLLLCKNPPHWVVEQVQ